MTKFESETIVALPERLETADTNTSLILMGQSNAAFQGAFATAFQGIGQSNTAGAIVTQVNL